MQQLKAYAVRRVNAKTLKPVNHILHIFGLAPYFCRMRKSDTQDVYIRYAGCEYLILHLCRMQITHNAKSFPELRHGHNYSTELLSSTLDPKKVSQSAARKKFLKMSFIFRSIGSPFKIRLPTPAARFFRQLAL